MYGPYAIESRAGGSEIGRASERAREPPIPQNPLIFAAASAAPFISQYVRRSDPLTETAGKVRKGGHLDECGRDSTCTNVRRHLMTMNI